MFTHIEKRLQKLPGKIGLYYKDLTTETSYQFNGQEIFTAASVIKLPLLVAVYHEIHHGNLTREATVQVKPEDKVPGCGVLTLMHDGLELDIMDLCKLMITISDNTATNILIDILGTDKIKAIFKEYNLSKTVLTRKLFDMKMKDQGFENYICPVEIGNLLEALHHQTILTPEICRELIQILKEQQLNSKIPHLLPSEIEVAHKTGEVTNVTHDVGIIYTDKPFILCFASDNTNVILAEEALREIALELCKQAHG